MGAFHFIAILVVGFNSAFAGSVNPQPLELRRLNKCHGLFVGTRILKTDSLWTQVSSGTLSGTDACIQLLNRASLGPDGRIAQISPGVYDPVGSSILSHFLEFHRSTLTVPEPSKKLDNAIDYHDANGAAHHFLYSLFKTGEPFNNTVKRINGIRAIRYSARTTPRTRSVDNFSSLISLQQGVAADPARPPLIPTLTLLKATPVDTGMLIGLKIDDVQNIASLMEENRQAYAGRNVTGSLGGGFLTDQAYFTANNNKNGTPANLDGGNQAYRLWAKSVLSDAICKTVPVLRNEDVVAEVRPASTFPWRQSASCLRCHISMDLAAGAARNLVKLRTASGKDSNPLSFWLNLFPNGTTSPSAPYPTDAPDAEFFKRPAEFTLKFRSYTGDLIALSGTGVPALGEKLASTDDLYVCAAKRYYEFLTGVQVNIDDPSDPGNPLHLSSHEQVFREKVISLGLQLKQDQSLKELIKKIIASPAFLNPDGGV